jgi:hypothetical protein
MFGGVDDAIHVQDFLGTRDLHVVDELLAEVAKAGAVAGAGEFRHPGATRAAMEVEAELRTESAKRSEFGRVDFGEIGVAFEDFTEAILDEDGEAEVGAEAFENVERG